MNKLIMILALLISAGAYAQESDEMEMRKGSFSILAEAELAPNTDYKTRGASVNVLYNVSDKFSVGFGAKPYGLFFKRYDVTQKWFTIDDNGDIEQHSKEVKEAKYDDEFCLPLYVAIKITLCKRTYASPFLELRVGQDVAYSNSDLYRALLVGSRFGFKKNYRRAINVASGLQLNPVDVCGSATFLFKVGYEF